MRLHALDIGIIIGYFIVVIALGLWVSRKGAKDLDSYFLGGKSMKWYLLGVSGSFNLIYMFPVLLVISVIGCVAGTLATEPEDDAGLEKFYRTVNPWGWWGPIRAKVMAEDASFAPNRNAARDLSNVAVGIVWQLGLVTLPIYLVLQQWTVAAGIVVLLAVTTGYIRINWYDRLEKAAD